MRSRPDVRRLRWLAALAMITLAVGCGVPGRAQGPSASATATASPHPSPGPPSAEASGPVPSRNAVDNALYQVDYSGARRCAGFTPRTQVPVDERVGYLQQVVDCLAETNREVLAGHGIDLTVPQVRLYGERESACGDLRADYVAAYCVRDGSIEYKITDLSSPDMVFDTLTIAHEFAHHLQQASGILPDADLHHGAVWPGEGSRRLELQAECMANVAVTAEWSGVRIPAAKLRAQVDQIRGEDSPTHGSQQSVLRWAKAGRVHNPKPWSVCNTWTAPAAEVD